ncbi:MAG: hypothetical protein KA248_10880 [Kiritimatiellae bacterium]|nr:hypothetical protein [Kiritimatiellia bacterium]
MKTKTIGATLGGCLLALLYQGVPARASWDEIIGQWAINVEREAKAEDESTVCAKVNMDVKQDLTLERQAFDAEVKIHNGYTTMFLQDVEVKIWITDLAGNLVPSTSDPTQTNAWFFVREPDLTNIDNVDGRGTVREATSATVHWLIIPAPGTGGNSAFGQEFLVGGRLRYKASGEETAIPLIPDKIRVKPMPRLALDYFLPARVEGDDPLTPAIEPPVPFHYGMRIRNVGAGAARNVNMSAGYPNIQRNNQELLVNFTVLGAEVNGQALGSVQQTAFNFGTIEPDRAASVRVDMECTLSGEFTDVRATVRHADELGGQLTSLIVQKNVHTLMQAVLMDLPGRDRIRDFLADDRDAVRLYESENLDTVVTNLTAASSLEWVDTGEGQEVITYHLQAPASLSPLYVGMPFPAGEVYELESVLRSSDGSALPACNVWITRNRAEGSTNRLFALHLFDSFGGGLYEIRLKPRPVDHNDAPVLQYIGRKVVRAGQQLGFLVQASDPNNVLPSLSAAPLPEGATFTDYHDGTGLFHWRTDGDDYGVHPVRFLATDGELTDWEIVRVYVGLSDEAFNAQGLPVSLADWEPEIKELVARTSSQTATVVWDSVEGLLYDVYAASNPFATNAIWQAVGENRPASGSQERLADSEALENVMRRYYRTVLAGERPDANKIWGLIRRDIRAAGYTMIAPPLRSDRRFDGEFGSALADVLQGRDGGLGSGADEIYILQPSGSWRSLYLDASGTWREAGGEASTYELPPGQGLWVARKVGTPARVTFTGPVGNDGSQTNRLVPGWNLIGLSEGKDVPLKQTFAEAATSQGSEEDSDILVLQKPDGSWRRLMYVEGWGAPYDGNWFDLTTFQIVSTNEVLQPGQAYYYLRRGAATDVEF